MRFFVSGQGFTYVDQHGNAQMIGRGHVFDTTLDEAPAGWQPPPDYDLLKPMDEAARKALQASIDAKRAESRGDAHGLPGGLPERVEIEIWRR